MNKTICFDFDGVIHKYREGYKDGSIYDEPNMDVVNIMKNLLTQGYSVAILSTREPIQISEWWNQQNFGVKVIPILNNVKFWSNTDSIGIFNKKIPAMVYIDDRALKFENELVNPQNLINKITRYKTHQEKLDKYFNLGELELLFELKLKTKKFEELNKKFDEKHHPIDNEELGIWKHKCIKNLMILDEWIDAVYKYL